MTAAAPYIDEWLKLSPFDRQAHELLLAALARQGRIAEGEAHLVSRLQAVRSRRTRQRAAARTLARRSREDVARAASDRRGRNSSAPTSPRSASSALTRPTSARRASIAVMPFVDRSSDSRQARRCGRRARLRRHHAPRQAAQHVRHCAGHHVRLARSRRRPRRSRPHPQCRLRGQRLGAAPGKQTDRERRTHRNAHRAHRLGRSVRREARRRARRSRRDRQSHRRLGRARNRNGRAQSRHPQAAELAGCLGSASPRPVAHVSLQQG